MSAKCYFFTGLSGSGKTTIARELNNRIDAVWMDGDEIRKTPITENVNDFSYEARAKHIRRLAYIASMFIERNINVIISCIASDRSVRREVRTYFPEGKFIEIYVNTPLEICEKRDPKGLYKRVRNGEIKEFTGISSRYEKPLNPEFIFDYPYTPSIIVNLLLEKYRPTMLVIGRFQPITKGHINLIDAALRKGNVIIGIKFSQIDINNPFTPDKIKKMLHAVYKKIRHIEVIVIPAFDFIGHGRYTGYSMKMIDVDEEIKQISATKIRLSIQQENQEWKNFVPEEVIPIMEDLINESNSFDKTK